MGRLVDRRAIRSASVVAAIVVGGAAALVTRATAQQNQNVNAVQMDVQQVSGNVYMVAGAEGNGNTTLFTGPEGVLVVDTQAAPLSGKILDVVRTLTDMHGDHVGGNEPLAKAGRTRAGGNVVGDIGQAATSTARIIAHENALNRLVMADPPVPPAALPTDTFFNEQRDMLFNGEAVQMFHQP